MDSSVSLECRNLVSARVSSHFKWPLVRVVDSNWNVKAHGDARKGEVKGKLANGVGSQYPSHYLRTWFIQHYYRWCSHLNCTVVDWTVPSHFNWPLLRVVDSNWNVKAHGDARKGEVKGKLANGVGSQYSSHYLRTWCIQHYYRWCSHLNCTVVDWTVPTHFNWPLTPGVNSRNNKSGLPHGGQNEDRISIRMVLYTDEALYSHGNTTCILYERPNCYI